MINQQIPLMEGAVDKMVCGPFVSLPYLHRSTLPLEFQNTYCGENLLMQHDEFLKMARLIDDLEVLLCEAANTYGVQWAEKPLWRTWSLDQFGRVLMLISRPYVTSMCFY